MSPKRISVDAGEIRRLYVEERWSRRRICEHLGVSDWVVEDRLRRLGIAIRPRGVLNDESARGAVIEKIKDLYLNQGMTIEKIAPTVHINRPTVSRVLKSEGTQVPRRPERDLKEILHMYHEFGWKASRIARHFGCTERAIFHQIMNSGVTRRSMRPQLDPVKIKEMYVDREMGIDKVVAHFQSNRPLILKILRDLGVETRKRGRASTRRSRFYDPRLGNLDVGDSFNIQCLDPATPRSYFLKLAKKMNIQIATQMVGPTALRITRVA